MSLFHAADLGRALLAMVARIVGLPSPIWMSGGCAVGRGARSVVGWESGCSSVDSRLRQECLPHGGGFLTVMVGIRREFVASPARTQLDRGRYRDTGAPSGSQK
ncbi:MAG: hypothetical protein V3T53_08905 [Phycisphaerales bacterium]